MKICELTAMTENYIFWPIFLPAGIVFQLRFFAAIIFQLQFFAAFFVLKIVDLDVIVELDESHIRA